MRVLIHSQSLLGIGHERRTQLIAKALHDRGLDTHLALGGPSTLAHAPGPTTHQLPSLRVADAAFSALVDDQGRPVDDAYKAARQASLAALFTDLNPDALILELFPFGRRMLRFELLPLLEQARHQGCQVYCSLRDILVAKTGAKSEAKRAWAVNLAKQHFDAVL
ncbi:MAG: glycosyl transferase, partial [Pseudomonadota bacterium]